MMQTKRVVSGLGETLTLGIRGTMQDMQGESREPDAIGEWLLSLIKCRRWNVQSERVIVGGMSGAIVASLHVELGDHRVELEFGLSRWL